MNIRELKLSKISIILYIDMIEKEQLYKGTSKLCRRPSNPHIFKTVRLTVWDANSRSHGFAS